jgi:hypothetical protein
VPGKAGESSAVLGVGVVKAGVLGFYTVKGAIEICRFDSHFRNEIAIYVSGESRRVALPGSRKESFVNEGGDGRF